MLPAWYSVSCVMCPDLCGTLLQVVEVEVNAELGICLHFRCGKCGQIFITTHDLMNLMTVCVKQDLRKERLMTGGLLPESAIKHADQIFLDSIKVHLGPDIR